MRGFLLFCLVLQFPVWVTANNEYTVLRVLPQIAQQGTEVEVSINGHELETASEVLFYRPGISCLEIRNVSEYPKNGRMEKAEPGQAIALRFRVASDAAIGEYFFRIRTEKKLSELLSFWVTPFPVVDEVDPFSPVNDTPETAQPVPLNSTIVGYQPAGPPNDLDHYSVTLTKGQLCTAQILSARLGTHHYGGLTDMSIEVISPSFKRVARCDDSPLLSQDPVVSFRAPETGDYVIRVGQQMDYETLVRHYALHLGEFPRPAVTYPLGGQAGEQLKLEVFYEDGTREVIPAKLPEKVGDYEAALVELPTVSDFPGPLPAPNLLKVADFPNVFEQDGPTTEESAQIIGRELPVALNGIIKEEGERDWFRFSAKKGERYRIRAYSRTLGSKLDPFIWIRPAEGTESKRTYEEDDSLWDGHDWEGHHYRHQVKDRLDPVFLFEPDADGEYVLGVGDTRREWGEDYIYRIEIQPHRDSIFSYFPDYPSQSDITRDVVGIHRGSTLSRPVAIQNGLGSEYDGPVQLEAKGLPKGVTFHCPVFTRNDPVILTTFTARADAGLSASLVELIPRALEPGVDLGGAFAQTTGATARRGGYNMVFNKTRFAAVAVLEEAPFSLRLEQPKVALAKNAELELEVSVQRRGDFKGAVYLEMEWLPPGVTKQPPLIIPGGETLGRYKLSATNQARDGSYELTIAGRENEGGLPRTGVGFHYVAAPPVTIEVSDPYLTIELERSAAEQGKRGVLTGRIHHLRDLPGNATATLLRLPTGVTLVKEAIIKPGDETVAFEIEIAGDALVGQYKEIACDIAITDAGQKIHQQTGAGVLRIDEARN
ncbi:MAG: PPC domain-containing protein [Verrucomicrobiales bacterium]|nr:PPC domain-containing protein [Verrucomicrobiales bacterium]